MKTLKLIGIKSNDGIYIDIDKCGYSRYEMSGLTFDGNKAESTFKTDWLFIKGGFKKIEQSVRQFPINKRYELIDKESFPNLKEVYTEEEAIIGETDDEFILSEEFKKVRSLYEFKQDEQEDKIEEVEFELNIVCEVDKIEPPEYRHSYTYSASWSDDNIKTIESESIKKRLIDEILTPDILLHEKQSSISSEMFYGIVRHYIKENIDPKYAEITSDYDFCFTVKKKIEKAEKEAFMVDVNNGFFQKRRRKPKYETRYRTHDSVEIFEMTHDGRNYDGYTPIIGLEAENEKSLNAKIDEYLEKLIEKINKPLKACSHCNGMGVILET